jgi:hypothetical protein
MPFGAGQVKLRGEKKESSRKNPLASPASWGAHQDNPPLSFLKSLRKTLTTRRDATQNLLRDLRRDLEGRNTHRQLRRNTAYPHAWGIHRRFIMPSQAIVIFRGTGHIFGTKSWQPRRKQKIQGPKKQIHLALRFRYTWAGIGYGGTNHLSLRTESRLRQDVCLFSCVHLRSFFTRMDRGLPRLPQSEQSSAPPALRCRLGVVFEEGDFKMAKKSRGGRMTAAKKRAAKKSGGRDATKKRAAGRNNMKT